MLEHNYHHFTELRLTSLIFREFPFTADLHNFSIFTSREITLKLTTFLTQNHNKMRNYHLRISIFIQTVKSEIIYVYA